MLWMLYLLTFCEAKNDLRKTTNSPRLNSHSTYDVSKTLVAKTELKQRCFSKLGVQVISEFNKVMF